MCNYVYKRFFAKFNTSLISNTMNLRKWLCPRKYGGTTDQISSQRLDQKLLFLVVYEWPLQHIQQQSCLCIACNLCATILSRCSVRLKLNSNHSRISQLLVENTLYLQKCLERDTCFQYIIPYEKETNIFMTDFNFSKPRHFGSTYLLNLAHV